MFLRVGTISWQEIISALAKFATPANLAALAIIAGVLVYAATRN
jgi:hypothetical protein